MFCGGLGSAAEDAKGGLAKNHLLGMVILVGRKFNFDLYAVCPAMERAGVRSERCIYSESSCPVCGRPQNGFGIVAGDETRRYRTG
jgi:hypothetical protein